MSNTNYNYCQSQIIGLCGANCINQAKECKYYEALVKTNPISVCKYMHIEEFKSRCINREALEGIVNDHMTKGFNEVFKL